MVTTKDKPRDYPFYEMVAKAAAVIESGGTVYQKFTCEKCHNRLAMDDANMFHKTGHCDKCGHITNLEVNGCGFMVFFSRSS